VYFIRCPSRLSYFFVAIHSTMRFVMGAAVLLGSRAALAMQVGDDFPSHEDAWEGSFVNKRQAMIQDGLARFVEDPDSEPFDNMGSDFYAHEDAMPAGMQRRMEMEENMDQSPPAYVDAPASAPGVVPVPAGDPYAAAPVVHDHVGPEYAHPLAAASVVHEHVGPANEKIVHHVMDPPVEHVIHHAPPVEQIVHHASPPKVTHVYDSSRRTDEDEEPEEGLIRSPQLERSMLEAALEAEAGERPLEEWAGSTGHGWDDDHFEHHEHDDDYDNGDHHHGHGRGHDRHNKGHSHHHDHD
jgi:hypothetical protein